jgi:hypothetical protein
VGDVDLFLAARVVLYPLWGQRQVWVAPPLDNRADLVDWLARLTGPLILPWTGDQARACPLDLTIGTTGT